MLSIDKDSVPSFCFTDTVKKFTFLLHFIQLRNLLSYYSLPEEFLAFEW